MSKVFLKESKAVQFLFFIIVFFPTKFFYLYFFITFLVSSLILITNSPTNLNKKLLLKLLLLFLYLIVGAYLRYIYYDLNDLRDFLEVGRFIPLGTLLLFSSEFSKLRFSFFLNTLKVYIIIDFIISYLQYINIESRFLHNIENIYSGSHQLERALGIAHRTIGLSFGPGDHGMVVLFICTFILITYIKTKKGSFTNTPILFLGFFSILTSQSQTAFIGLFVLHTFVFLYFFAKEKCRTQYILYFSFFLSFFLAAIYIYIDELRYLVTLFEYGLERSSYQTRKIKTQEILSLASSSNLGFFIGWGKSYFGDYSSSMDNEHLYILVVYGPLIYVLFIISLLKLLIVSIRTNNLYKQMFVCTVFLGLPMAWPSSYYLTPKIMLILTMFYINYFNDENKNENTITSRY